MNWFDTSGITNLAKNALKEAQKTLDKALEIQDESEEEDAQTPETSKEVPSTSKDPNTDFFASWGLTVSAEDKKEEVKKESSVVTESPSKANAAGLWGSFAGSFFDPTNSEEASAIMKPPKAKSMNVITDFNNQEDLFAQSQLVMSGEGAIGDFHVKEKGHKEDINKIEDRRSSSKSAGLSLMSSSDSVEVLSHSMKSTPDSEAVSVHSDSLSCSLDKKVNSESVEILPDSLVSPSSIECLGFDSYSSDRNSTPSSNLTPDDSAKKTPVGDLTEKANTADSVGLVAEDDDDTVSYNSVSECTAPTVLDTDDKIAPFTKPIRVEPRKLIDRDLMHLDSMQRMQFSENSSNDGSWSDRTLNADNDSVNLEEDKKKGPSETEDVILDKLSDSSSFYNMQMSSDLAKSESSAFVSVEKHPDSNPSSHKDTVKERTSPVSTSSKSDLVKIGSDRTSGHTSGDDLETATSSDIEIIPSPNGDNCRSSPSKYGGKLAKLDSMAPNLVDLVLGKSLATKIRGHNRELSEASVQSVASDDSLGSENDKLLRRLCEMAEILEARESKLIEVSRNNADLSEHNENLKRQMESLLAKNEAGDINTITEEYTQRMSALEKKFQQAIREKDQIRKQLETVRTETSRRTSSEFENIVKEKDDMIAQLQEEGEKLSKQQLHHSNIIKKLRGKEKDNEQVIKSLRDKISEQTSELDRLKRSLSMKEEVEVSQIEAIYRLTTTNKKLEADYLEAKSLLEDALQRYETTQITLDATKRELSEMQRASGELTRRSEASARLASEREQAVSECERLRAQLHQLRSEMMQEERRWSSREEALRREVESARATSAASDYREARDTSDAHAAALLAQLAAMQRALLRNQTEHQAQIDSLCETLAEKESQLTKSQERERLSREEAATFREQLLTSQGLFDNAHAQLKQATDQWHAAVERCNAVDGELRSKISELEREKQSLQLQLSEMRKRVIETEALLDRERSNVDTERKRNAILQEQLSARGDVSPTQSLASDTLSNSLWAQDELPHSEHNNSSAGMFAVEELMSTAQRHSSATRAAHHLATSLAADRDALTRHVATLTERLQDQQTLREQYDALLEMYGEKEEQLAEIRLDLADVTQLYKQQLDELVALRECSK